MRKIAVTIMLLIFICACDKEKQNQVYNDVYEIEVIKFMNLNTYARSVDEDIFWSNEDELAKFKIKIDKEAKTFKDEILTFKKTDGKDFLEYQYALLIKKGPKVDTLYSDYSLRNWKHKINNETIDYSDVKGYYPSFLRESYPFFNDCW
ncbi:hypothetical protein [Flavobacterium pedocola]